MTELSSPKTATETSEAPTVLVVDDDQDLADTYAVGLADHCDVETAYGGVEARKRIDDDIDVVLLDRRMPGIPGDKVLEEIRERDIDCQVAMLTAVEPDTDIIELPFDEYLVKPVTRAKLRETVDDLLLRSGFEPDAQEYFALESKSQALETRETENLRDPEAAAELKSDADSARETERVQNLRERLRRLQRLTSVIRDIDKQLVKATSREEIERTTCERLVEAEPYGLAWIGDYTVSFDQVTARVVAESNDATLDADTVADGENEVVSEAVSDRKVRVVENPTTEGEADFLSPLEAAPEREFVAGAAVPLVYRDTVYGVLNVYTDEVDVFDDREVAVLSELGDSIANAINSVESKKLMLSDTVVELEFEVHDTDDVFVSLSAETGARIELKGFVPAADGGLTSYLEVKGATTESFLDAATGMDGVRKVRGIGESSEQNLYECRIDGSTIVLSLIEAGADVSSMCVDEGRGDLAAAVAPETDVRTVVEALQGQFDGIDLVAKRETERDFQSTEDFRQSLENRLTDRQYSVLQAAYSAGYFDWPRGSTAEEIAESLDLAPPTLHEHLRAAQKELMGAFFEETGEFENSRVRSDR